MHDTLRAYKTVGRAALGDILLGRQGQTATTSTTAPILRGIEDAKGMYYCANLDQSVPVEVNVVKAQSMVRAIANLAATTDADIPHIPQSQMFRTRASIASFPGEYIRTPAVRGLRALEKLAGQDLADARAGGVDFHANDEKQNPVAKRAEFRSDAAFWDTVVADGLFPAFLQNQVDAAGLVDATLLSPAVPVVDRALASSPEQQENGNQAAEALWDDTPGTGDVGLLYNMSIHASAFHDPNMMMEAARRALRTVEAPDSAFYGIRMEVVDLAQLTSNHVRIQTARELVRHVSEHLRSHARQFLWASDVGAIGPALLDEGAAISTYHPGLTPRRIHMDGGGFKDKRDPYGKLLAKWEYNLDGMADLEAKNWRFGGNSLFPDAEIPLRIRGMKAPGYRVRFSKPSNIASMEDLNIEREKALNDGQHTPGRNLVGRSTDDNISPWAA